jgi:hypothetical protein
MQTLKTTLALSLLALALPSAMPAHAQSASPLTQYLIHVPGVSVTIARDNYFIVATGGLSVYMYNVTSRAVGNGDYNIFVDRASPQQVSARTTTAVHDGWRWECQVTRSRPCPFVYRRMARHGHPVMMTSLQYTAGTTLSAIIRRAVAGSVKSQAERVLGTRKRRAAAGRERKCWR